MAFSLLIFLGAPLALAEGADISVDMIVNILPKGIRRVVDTLVNLLIAVFACLCMRSLVTFIGSNKGVTAVSMTWIKMNWLYYAFFVSFAFLAVVAVVKAVMSALGKNECFDINAEEKEPGKKRRVGGGSGNMKTMIVVILICMLLLFLLKVPVYISMALTGCALMVATSGMKWSILTQYLYTGTNSFTLLAIPLFLLAAKLMNTGGITKKLFAFCMKVVGWLPGGLGHVNILSSVIFAGMSGTAVSDAGGLGAIEIKAMNEHGFDNDFSCCVTAASSTMGPIIPPSIPLVVYATVSGASVGALFMAGIVPGIVMALLMMVVVTIYAIKRHYPRTKFPTFHEFGHALKEGFLPLMAPIILLVGIYGGVFTPTESAAIVVLYSLFLDVVVYRELSFKKFIAILKETVRDSLTIALIIAGATFFGYVATRAKIPQMILTSMTSVVSSKVTLLLIINVFLLIVGCFLETASAITIVVPLILPLLTAYNINLTQFGIIMVLNLMIGLLTPPFGLVLFVISKIGHISIGRFSKALVPWLGALLAALLLVTFIPQLSLWFPTMLGMSV